MIKSKIFLNVTICCWEKHFPSHLMKANFEDLAKASVLTNNLFCY